MNKLNVDTRKLNLELNSNLYLNILVDTKLFIKVKSKKDYKLLIYAKDIKVDIKLDIIDSELEINNLGINASINYNINLKSSNLKVVDSILTNIDSNNNIVINSLSDNNITFDTNGINLENNKLYFNIDGIIKRKDKNVFLEENSKIINILEGDSKIIPNLIIDSKEVIANHSAFIGTFNKDLVYYLMSRGISLNNTKKILLKAILLNKMNLEIENDFEDLIDLFLINYNGGDKFE